LSIGVDDHSVVTNRARPRDLPLAPCDFKHAAGPRIKLGIGRVEQTSPEAKKKPDHMITGATTMKTIILSTMLAIVVATTGAVSASAKPYQGLPSWAVEVFTPTR
jgi:hypothetical protein